MKNKMRAFSTRSALVAAAAGVLVVGCGAGAFAAASPALLAPKGLSAASAGVKTTPMPDPQYKKNAAGQTYGSAADSNAPENEPDLIAVVTTNNLTTKQVSRMSVAAAAATDTGGGQQGYVKKDELAEADGSNVSNPEEAAKWMAGGAKEDHLVPVYASDGMTQIGTFVIYGSDSTGEATGN